MVIVKRMVCLANSRKINGRCLAGIELESGKPVGWIRPVSARPHQEVSEYERQYPDGGDPQVLDLLDVPLTKHVPSQYQQENWLLDPDHYWEKRGALDWHELQELVENEGDLWANGDSTHKGMNDRVRLDRAVKLNSSLRLISVGEVSLHVLKPGEAFGNPKRRVQARFHLNGVDYWLWVTDPRVERAYLAQPDGKHDIGSCCMTVSLGEPHEGATYKLVAAVIRARGTDV